MYDSDRPIWRNSDFGVLMVSGAQGCAIVRCFAHEALWCAEDLARCALPGTSVHILMPGSTQKAWSYTVPAGGMRRVGA